MPINCEEKLAVSIQKDCDNKPVGGIEVNVVLINFDDVDKVTSVINATNKMIIDSLATYSTKAGFSLEGVKQVNGASSALVKNEEGFDKHAHRFDGVILTPSAVNKEAFAQITSGGRYIVVIEKKWKGAANAEAFEVLGWDSGLIISEYTWNTKESDGAIKFSLASEAKYEEPEFPRTNLETNYATTKVAFDALYATI
jgi:hypothetical protein